jgi:signal recognition particle subunit SRP54
MASRILGMGDVLTMIEKAQSVVDEKKAAELEKKLRKNQFTLEDFRDQLVQVRKMGSLTDLIGMIPGMGKLKQMKNMDVDESELVHIEAIINSMTPRSAINIILSTAVGVGASPWAAERACRMSIDC